jgi:hypothetical protein
LKQSDGYFNLRSSDGAYFSNFGGVANKMGFWNGDGTESKTQTDPGSLFKFVEVEFPNDNPRYYQLSDVKATMQDGTNIYGGTSVGLYTGGKEYREAYTTATSLLTADNTSAPDACYEAYKNLRTTKEGLSFNEADPTKFYVIKSTATNDYCKGKYVTTNCEPHVHHHSTWGDKTYDHRHLLFEAPEEISQVALRIFQLETTATQGEYKMKNLHTGLYVKSFAKNSEHMDDASSAAVIKISGVADGQVKLQIGNNDPMHAQNDFSAIVQWGASVGNASTWTIDEINVEDICHNVTISSAKYSTLFLNYPVTIPNGVTAYTANEIIDDKWLNMQEITNGVILANTAVVLQGDGGTYGFKLAKEPRTVVEVILTGTLYKQTIDKVNGNYYVLANTEDGVGFYNAVNNR